MAYGTTYRYRDKKVGGMKGSETTQCKENGTAPTVARYLADLTSEVAKKIRGQTAIKFRQK